MLGIPSWVKNSLKHWVHVNALYVVLINVVQSDLRKTQAQYMKNDPNYLSCKKKECKTFQNGKCAVSTCSGSLQFHVVNIRSDIEFVFFSGGFVEPCLVGRSTPVSFANPKRPLYGHLSSIDSTGTSVSSKLLFLLQIFSVHLFLISNVIWCCRWDWHGLVETRSLSKSNMEMEKQLLQQSLHFHKMICVVSDSFTLVFLTHKYVRISYMLLSI